MIFLKRCWTGRSANSPVNNACKMFKFDAVSSVIDPTLSNTQFRNVLLHVPDVILSQSLDFA